MTALFSIRRRFGGGVPIIYEILDHLMEEGREKDF